MVPRARADDRRSSQLGRSHRTALIVDEVAWWLEGLERLLEELGIEVVGKLTRPSAAIAALPDLQPDLLVTSVDNAPTEPDLASYLAQAFDAAPGMNVVVLSERRDGGRIDEAFAAGAAAFVTRSATCGDLATAIRHAFRPTVYLAVAPQLRPEVEALTHRELEVLQLTAQGRSNVEIARILWVTEQTVKFHLSNVYRKLGVANRTEASRWASAQGLTSDLARSE